LNSFVVASLPKTGLANKLTVWALAQAFAIENDLPVMTIGWFDLKVGPWLRNEKSKRFYCGYFKNDFNLSLYMKYIWARILGQIVIDPEKISHSRSVFVFQTIKYPKFAFSKINPYRESLSKKLETNLSTKIRKKLNALVPAQVGVHIRMGDFKTLSEDKEFKSIGRTRTPFNFFKDAIEKLSKKLGEKTTFLIFSDGKPSELEEILKLNNVKLEDNNPDVVDLFLLSKCKIIVTSAGSSFSYWAAFLSKADIIYHPNFKKSFFNSRSTFEGTVDEYVARIS